MIPKKRKHWVIPPEKMSLLVSDRRHRIMPPFKTLRSLGLCRGLTFLDAGCGPGFFTIPACKIVGREGRVFACDTSPSMLRAARERANEFEAKNIHWKKSIGPDIPFSDSCVDMAMAGFVLHETESIRHFLSGVRRVLRPHGWAVFMEWRPRETDYGPPLWSRLGMREVKETIRSVGLSVVDSWSFDEDTYFVIARHKHKRTRARSRLHFPEIQKITRRKSR